MDLKIAVLGPCRAGKTLLCRALAEQPLVPEDYEPTAGVRRAIDGERRRACRHRPPRRARRVRYAAARWQVATVR
jgi:hypothetical protein